MYEHISLFNSIQPNSIPQMLDCIGGYKKSFKKDEFILLVGDPLDCLGVILSGNANIIKEDYAGNRVIKSALSSYEIFAHSIVSAGIKTSPFSIIAKQETVVLFLPFRKILSTCANSCSFHHQLIFNLVAILAKDTIAIDKKLDYITAKNVRAKISRYLLDIYTQQKTSNLSIPFNRTDLANFLCIERSVLSRELSKLKKEGVIDFDKNTFILSDCDRLFEFSY